MVLGWVLGLAVAVAGDGALTPQQVALAEWSRDLDTLLAGPYDDAVFPQVARALGRLRDAGALERLTLLAGLSAVDVRREAYVALGTTPGGATVLRERLAVEGDPALAAVALRALGRCGDAADVDLVVAHLSGPGEEAAAAALALGLLARRSVDVSRAVPTLVGMVDRFPSAVAPAAAYALYRAQPTDLSPPLVRRLLQAYARLPDDASRAWLVPVLAANLHGARVDTWVLSVLGQPYRLAKTALLATTTPLVWTEDDLRRLGAEGDPWLTLRVAERAPLPPPVDADEAARRAVAAGEGSPSAWEDVVQQAVGATRPATRSAAAAALLAHAPDDRVLDRLAESPDPAVAELLSEHLAEAGTAQAWTRLLALAGRSWPDASMVVVLRAVEDGVDKGRALSSAAVDALTARVSEGRAGVAARAAAILERSGHAAPPVPPSQPGPSALPRDLASIGRIRGAVVSTTEGTFRLALDPDTAPLAVATFAWLAEQGFGADSAYADVAWTGTTFHRVVPGFVVQSGDPRGDGLGGPGWLLPDETSGLPFVTGALGMATSGPDEGGSQWFVTTSPQPHLVGGYTRFGVVTDGLDVVQRLDPGDRVLDVVIERTPEATP